MESGDEDEAFTMGEREWQKMSRNISQHGYRDGKNDGREQGLQTQFESAVPFAFRHSLKLGQLLGLIEWNLNKCKDDEEKKKALEALKLKIQTQLTNLKDTPIPNITSTTDTASVFATMDTDWNERMKELVNDYLVIYPDKKCDALKFL